MCLDVECCKTHRPLQNSALNDAESDDSNAKASPSVNSNELTYDVSSLVNSINTPGLKIGCLNVRGLVGKIDELCVYVKPSLIVMLLMMKSAFKIILLFSFM